MWLIRYWRGHDMSRRQTRQNHSTKCVNQPSAISIPQTANCINPAQHPRGAAVKALINTLSLDTAPNKRGSWTDRLANSIKDVYTADKVSAFTRLVWRTESLHEIGIAFRTGVDFLFADSMLLRWSNRNRIKLADTFCLPLKAENTKALVVLMDHSKTNKNGQARYTTCLKNRDPFAYPIGQLAFSLFFRWQVEDGGPDLFPDLRAPEKWYKTKLFIRRSPKEPEQSLAYQTHMKHLKEFYKGVNILSTKLSHLPRVSNAQRQEGRGVPAPQIRRAGGWNANDAVHIYLPTLAYAFMRSTAGFDHENAKSYFLPREQVDPPQFLRSQVWPELNDWLRVSRDPSDKRHDIISRNKATAAFIELLKWLRDVFLQDAVFLQQEYPKHPIFSDSLFRTTEWEEFATQVRDQQATQHQHSHYEQIKAVMPIVAERMDSEEANNKFRHKDLKDTLKRIEKRMHHQDLKLEAFRGMQYILTTQQVLTPRKSQCNTTYTHAFKYQPQSGQASDTAPTPASPSQSRQRQRQHQHPHQHPHPHPHPHPHQCQHQCQQQCQQPRPWLPEATPEPLGHAPYPRHPSPAPGPPNHTASNIPPRTTSPIAPPMTPDTSQPSATPQGRSQMTTNLTYGPLEEIARAKARSHRFKFPRTQVQTVRDILQIWRLGIGPFPAITLLETSYPS
ncbi:hypothetical protein FJTKL_15299 [Diaporthe vaccinii]|uniref:Ndc10 domain-containing protein n=1 Tax=Diaporthe vaccinii TaxID=105482 RepID=A0ABR4E5B8_9PEZI